MRVHLQMLGCRLNEAELQGWAHEFTEVITANREILHLPPAQRLLAIMQMVDEYNLTRFDVHFRSWAKNDPAAARGVREVIRILCEHYSQNWVLKARTWRCALTCLSVTGRMKAICLAAGVERHNAIASGTGNYLSIWRQS